MQIKRLRFFVVVLAAFAAVALGMQSAGAASRGSAAGGKPVAPEKRSGPTKTAAPKIAGTAIYDSMPSPLPPNYPSQPFQAQQTSEFGDEVSFAGTARRLQSVTVGMSTWAKHSDWLSVGGPTSWQHPIRLKIYAVNNSGPTPVPGLLLASKTVTFDIPWRPESDPTCPDTGYGAGFAWRSPTDLQCYNGFAFTISFDFSSSLLILPNQVIYGIEYNTNTWGPNPIGSPGPYESLNVGLNDTPASITVGTDVEPDAAFWNTKTAGYYTDGGAAGVGIFRRDTGWAPYTAAVTFNATPFSGGRIYDSVPNHRTNYPSIGFQAQQTAELGDEVSFAGPLRDLTAVTVGMSDWAKHSDYPSMAQSGWSHPITLNIYGVDESGPNPAVGPLLTTKTVTFDIPWRPEADPTCPNGGTAWRAGDNQCYNGLGFTITFDFTTSSITLPDKVIYGIVYNTNTWGPSPIGSPGPYESLNVGLNQNPPDPIVVGTDVEPDAVFWNTATASNYSDGGPCCMFRRDTLWAPYTPAVTFRATNASPTAVQVRSFTATRTGSDVVLRWRTGSEAGALGYNVFRNGVRLNRSLIAVRGSLAGATYRFTASGHPARAVYRLQAVYANGSRSFLARATRAR